jgi:hypothetical protein
VNSRLRRFKKFPSLKSSDCNQPEAVVARDVTTGRNWPGPVSQAVARKLIFDVRASHAEVG